MMIITTTGMLTTIITINTDRNVTTTVHNIARLQGKIMDIIGIIGLEMRITHQMNETIPVIIITLMVGIKDITMKLVMHTNHIQTIITHILQLLLQLHPLLHIRIIRDQVHNKVLNHHQHTILPCGKV